MSGETFARYCGRVEIEVRPIQRGLLEGCHAAYVNGSPFAEPARLTAPEDVDAYVSSAITRYLSMSFDKRRKTGRQCARAQAGLRLALELDAEGAPILHRHNEQAPGGCNRRGPE